jgi:hypothetical protein
MALEQIDLVWIAQKMESGKWYNIKNAEQLRQFMQLIDKSFGFDKFQLSLSPDYKQVKKTEI